MGSKQPEPIAIVGSACRFPGGANSPSELWKLLESPHDVCVDILEDRFNATTFYHPDGNHHGTTNVRQSYLLQEDVRVFDAAFFNISPNEADSMDPQQRLLLETVYEALEAGGHTLEALRGSDTGVYAGTMTADYNDTLTRDHNTMPKYFATGTNRAIISNRVSYFFDWHGPSMTIDTACSSSLVAVHQGVKALRTGESRVAVACGTQVILNPEMYINESKLKMLSPTGRSRMWDADADGYARGEGVAAVVLKRLSDAIADGDDIECVVRETGANQDGFSNGLTVPNADAQTMLIRQTYARAGLDPENDPWDRPQFFEAHGTGTQAGDPKEAAAIHQCFGQHVAGSDNPMYVGSVKTVIGHLEGCAGLAGILKGSAMIKRGFLAPNLHFNRLNPRIEPYYHGLHVMTQLSAWPKLPEGVPRRVSINSFGFGGTNAHAILEQYQTPAAPAPQVLLFTPFVFSAVSEASLVAQLQAYSNHLKTHHDNIDASDLAWTLHSRRSQLSTKTTFSALTIEQLTSKIDSKLAEVSQNADATVGTRSNTKTTPRLLGVFTGQGAQWAAMGAHLFRSSDFVRERIQHLEQSLATLPLSDRPAWKFQDEMLAGDDISRIGEAALSQPLCTAIQIVLVDLLRAAGITFAAVVGHSSGEIAAAYAAGFISDHDAIRIAYYRGLFARLAGNEGTGQKGAMLAVGTSWEDAQDLVNLPAFEGRLVVAAHNSPASVTLSGDADAVVHAKEVFDEDKKFARLLKVDTAYHSHHMLPCGDAYVQALRACGIQINQDQSNNSCSWFSSVTPSAERMEPIEALQDVYWKDNMTKPVLFSEAVKNAVASDERINLVVEVGPHPALKGPVTQNISEVRTAPLPYCSTLSRGKNDVEVFSEALGFVWTHFPHFVDFQSLDNTVTCNQSRRSKLVVGLPSYQWNHKRSHWSESRISRRIRERKQPHHEILGFLSTDSSAHELRWVNVLKQSEIPWLDGHQLQGQTVFPAAGYVAMALEASRSLVGAKAAELIELHHLVIPRAIIFEEGDDSGVETLVTLTGAQFNPDQTATAHFACYSVPILNTGSQQEMELMAAGTVKVVFGIPDVAALSCTPPEDYDMSTADTDLFYSTLSELGYGYFGPFRAMSSMKRRLNQSSVLVDSYPKTDVEVSEYLVHPSMLDVAFQASILAYSAPGDERLWSLSVPTAIGTIRVNPEVCASLPTSRSKVPVCAALDGESESFSASIDIFSEDGEHGMVQVEDLVIKPFAPATKADDRVVFTHTKFDFALPDGAAAVKNIHPSAYEVELATVCERISYYYVRKWKSELSDDEWANGQPHWLHLLEWVNQTLSTASRAQHPTLKREWSDDSPKEIQALISKYSESIDVKLLEAVGENLPAAVRGETTILEHMLPNNMLDDWYKKGLGFARYNSFLASMMKQVTHRYPHARILEIGAGTGGATKSVLESIGDKFSSYTYTDVSVGFFSKAAELFKAYSDKMTFKVLDIETAPTNQGYEPHSYDIIIASNVLHATASLQTTLENTRQLLKPGGYLMLLEVTSLGPVRYHSIVGSVPGWWLGVNDDRKLSPLLTPGGWHSALRKAGFGGVDAGTPEIERVAWPLSIMASQAVDERVQFLRRPLSSPSPSIHLESLVILGNRTVETARIGEEVVEHLGRFCGETITLNGLPTEDEALNLNPSSTFLNLVDIDSPIFKDMTAEKMDGLKRILELAKRIIWVTHGAQQDQGYHMASITFSRAIRQEAGHISLSHLDISDLQHNESKNIAEYLLQQSALDEWEAPPSTLADKQHREFGFLWSREPEVFLDRGKLKIPRLLENTDQNARLNSSRRVITKTVPMSGSNVTIISASDDSPPSVVEQVGRKFKEHTYDLVKVKSSSLMALHIVGDTFLFLGVGKGKDGTLQVSLATTNSCETTTVASVAAPPHAIPDIDADGLLVAAASELLAESLIHQMSTESHILVHCSGRDRFLAAAFSRRAAAKAVRVTFTCDSQDKQQDATWIRLNARAPNHVVRRMLRLANLTHYLDLTATSSPGDLSLRLAQALPLNCTRIEPSALFQRLSSSLPLSCDHGALMGRLEDAVSSARLCPAQFQDLVTPLDHLHTLSRRYATSAVHWPLDGLIEVEVRPLDARGLFSKYKTYLLVGLSGQIGRSLCEWMVLNGAGCVCLTSRRPKIEERWVESFRETGATVKVFAMDVIDKSSLERVVKDIRTSCLPIAGVANGAMVLDDQLFANMSADTMRKVLGPKIDGSKNLDDVFHDDDLDFFILFSSVTCVFGNAGQSNYTAASGYVNGLVRQRRNRGLAASAIDIGRVAGIGYIEAAGQAARDQLRNLSLAPLSESDFRQMIAETIVAGYADPECQEAIPEAVVTTGLRIIGDDEDVKGPWFSNAFFSHMVRESKSAASGPDEQSKKSTLPVSQQLSMAVTKEEALDILQESLVTKLRIILQLGDQPIEYEAPLIELGMDSLVAVEVRSWFLKELKVDIPVLKVVGGASLVELCQKALEKLPEELLASLGKQNRDVEPHKPVVALSKRQLQLQLQAQPQVQDQVVDSESTSVSGDDSSSSPETRVTPRSMTTTTTPSSARSVSDPAEFESAKPAPALASSVLPPRRFLKSELISLPQSRFWFLRHLLEDPTTPNICLWYDVTGDLRVGDLERAIRIVTTRHEALRTCFIEDETNAGEAYQKVLPSSPLRLERKKINSVQDFAAEYTKLKGHVFDLEGGDVMRMVLLTLSSASHYLLFNFHHIVMDGASFNIFVSDLEKAYSGQSLGAPPRQYPDFSLAQRQALEKGDMRDELSYWQRIFPAGEQPPVLPLFPMARTSSRVIVKAFESHQVGSHLEPSLVARVKSVSKAQRSTPFHLHLAAFKAMLFCFAGEDTKDLTIGIADAARNDSDLKDSIGFFLNLLTLRFRRQPDQSFADAIVEARNETYAALGSSRLPFDVLLADLNVARSPLHSPFFQAFLDYRQGVQKMQSWGNCEFEFQEAHPGRTAYDITLDVTEWSATETLVIFRVQKSLYDLTAANLLLETYIHFLDIITSDASLSLRATPLFGESQLSQAVEIGRGLNLISDWPGTLPHRIDQVAQENQNKVALMDGTGKVLTYLDMMNRIDAISEALQNAGVSAGSRVLVFQQPAADWTCSMLAIMRIGAIYVPLDLRNPIARLAAVVEDCEPSAIVVDATTVDDASQLKAANARIVNVSDLAHGALAHVANRAQPDSPAAILYTSGSTGTPKGIVVTHAGLRNEIEGYTKTWGLGAERVLQQSSFTFNHSSDQMYTGLVNGGMVYVVPADKRGDPLEIVKIVLQQSITYTKATPSEYSLWMQYGGDTLRQASSWRFAFCGGEPLTSFITQEFADLGLTQLRLFNSYGPTEISISSHKLEIPYHEIKTVENMSRIPCGYSLPNYYTYIVDEQLRLVPIGMPGEICLGGAGVSFGYLNNQELTSQHFVPDPFATPEDIARGWTRMYRTGDMGLLREDGAMIFHSRMAGDSQVKIRGLRIELSDIESNIILTAGGALREAVVTLREGDPAFLVAHVVFALQHDIPDKDAFLEHLLSHLPIPQYMVPVIAIPLDKFPLSNHSKVDRKAVQDMPLRERVGGAQEDTELTETVVQLKRVWRDILGRQTEKLGFDLTPSSNFFLVGGNSLLVIRLQARIRQVFNIAVPLINLLGASTLGEMARKIEKTASVDLIDWELETCPPVIPSFLPDVPVKSKTKAKTILATGGTSFLAKYFLPQLAARSDIDTIHCVAVRDKPRKEALFSSPKMVYHFGDLSLPLLGLSIDKFRKLASQVDVILHMGVVRSFWDNYHVLRPSNVLPTKELVKLAEPHHIPIHYFSTVGVLPRGADGNSAGSAAAYMPSLDGTNGYVATKWAGERILERSAASLGIPSTVYRFLPASQQHPSQKQELLDTIVDFVDVSGMIPDMSVWSGRLDLIPAEQVSQWLCNSVTTAAATVATATQFSHYESPITIHTDELSSYIKQQRADWEDLEQMPLLSWFGRIKALGFNYLVASQEINIGGSGSGQGLESRR